MLESAAIIISQYIDNTHWLRFRDFELIDIDVEERGYLCLVDDKRLFIYEADFLILDLPKILEEVAYVFEDRKLAPRHWLTKQSPDANATSFPLDTAVEDNPQLYDSLIYKDPKTRFIYAVLELQ